MTAVETTNEKEHQQWSAFAITKRILSPVSQEDIPGKTGLRLTCFILNMTPGVNSGARELSLEQHKGISIILASFSFWVSSFRKT